MGNKTKTRDPSMGKKLRLLVKKRINFRPDPLKQRFIYYVPMLGVFADGLKAVTGNKANELRVDIALGGKSNRTNLNAQHTPFFNGIIADPDITRQDIFMLNARRLLNSIIISLKYSLLHSADLGPIKSDYYGNEVPIHIFIRMYDLASEHKLQHQVTRAYNSEASTINHGGKIIIPDDLQEEGRAQTMIIQTLSDNPESWDNRMERILEDPYVQISLSFAPKSWKKVLDQILAYGEKDIIVDHLAISGFEGVGCSTQAMPGNIIFWYYASTVVDTVSQALFEVANSDKFYRVRTTE